MPPPSSVPSSVPSFSLRCFRSLWAAPSERALLRRSPGSGSSAGASHAERLVSHFHRQGFDGVEASLADLSALGGARHVQRLLAARGMGLVVGVYSGWADYEAGSLHEQFEGVPRHLERLRRQLDAALAAGERPVRINVHAGSDRWGRAQALDFLARALELERQFGCGAGADALVSYETHRGRVLYSPWPALELLEALPGLQLTLDLSHWTLVAERLLDAPQDDEWLLGRVVPRVRHVHGRVGSAQRAQLERPHDPRASAAEDARFQRLWDAVWTSQRRAFQREAAAARGSSEAAAARAFATFTPEYGPAPYAPSSANGDGGDAYDVDELCAQRAALQRRAFADLMRQGGA